jgi:hypothetical protein
MRRPSQLNPIIVETGKFLGTMGVQELGLAAERQASFCHPSIFHMTPRACNVHATCGRQSARSRAGQRILAGLSHSLHNGLVDCIVRNPLKGAERRVRCALIKTASSRVER